MTAIQIFDLNTTLDREPRVRDLLIAERLEMKNPHSIRMMIEGNRAELEGYGPISAEMRMVAIGSGARRKVIEYWLNEGQALVICALSRTPKAAAVRKELIDVYLEYRRGRQAPTRARRGTRVDFLQSTPIEVLRRNRDAVLSINQLLLQSLETKLMIERAAQAAGVNLDIDGEFMAFFNGVSSRVSRLPMAWCAD